MKHLTYGSLFSGIGGIDLGLDRAGMTCKWQVEIDDYATKVLAKHWPDVARFRDIRDCGKHNLTPVKLIAGGFPCQPHSLAGKRKASSDERDLWGEFYRIICQLRPSWVLVENVPGLLSSENGQFFGRILRDLAQAGYDAEWQVLSAAAIGAPHLRERVFIIAYTHSQEQYTTQKSTINYQSGIKTSFEWICGSHADVAHTSSNRSQASVKEPGIFQEESSQRLPQSCIRRSPIFRGPVPKWGIWANESSVGRVADGVPNRVQRIKGLGNAVVPQCAEYVGRCIMAAIEADREVAV